MSATTLFFCLSYNSRTEECKITKKFDKKRPCTSSFGPISDVCMHTCVSACVSKCVCMGVCGFV